MSACPEFETLLHGLFDGELDAANAIRCEQHLAECAACAAVYAESSSLRTAIRGADLRRTAPEHLQARIRASLARQGILVAQYVRRIALPVSMTLAACLMLFVMLPRAPDIGMEVAAGHVRSMMAAHLTDVQNSDHHTVKPWFMGRLNYSPPVYDLAQDGFPLAGGRIDYIDNRPVAAIVYRHGPHIINLFIWPTEGADIIPTGSIIRQGYNIRHWTKLGMTCWAVSDLNASELARFEQLIRTATPL